MQRQLLLRPFQRAIRAQGHASCSRQLFRSFSTTPCRKFGATASVNKKKMNAVDAAFFGGGEEVLDETVLVPPFEEKSKTSKQDEELFFDPNEFGTEFEEEPSYTSEYVDKFDADTYFSTWMSPNVKLVLRERGESFVDYIYALSETPTTLDMLSGLDMSEMEEFERYWLLCERNYETDPQSVVPLLAFLLKHGVEFKAPSADSPLAHRCVAVIDPKVAERGLQSIEEALRTVRDEFKPPSEIIPYPDLMQPDALLDPRDEIEFPATPENPFKNRVIVRNHRSVFHEYAKGTEGDESAGVDDLLEQDELPDNTSESKADEMMQNLAVSTQYYYDLHQSILMRRSVVQQTGKGKIRRLAYMVLVGNGDGLVGYGVGKHENGAIALKAARIDAVKNMDWVERFEKRTIWTDMSTKFGATKILMRPRPVGFGLRCNPYLHQILRAAGLKDISAKVWGSRNRLNVIQAVFRMLHAGHAPTGMGDGLGGKGKKLSKGSGVKGKSDMERARGRKLISLRK